MKGEKDSAPGFYVYYGYPPPGYRPPHGAYPLAGYCASCGCPLIRCPTCGKPPGRYSSLAAGRHSSLAALAEGRHSSLAALAAGRHSSLAALAAGRHSSLAARRYSSLVDDDCDIDVMLAVELIIGGLFGVAAAICYFG